MANESFIETVNKIRENLDAVLATGALFSQEVVDKIESLSGMDLTLIIEDFAKGNYLGNRKVDIDLALNNLSITELPTYKQADVILVNGIKLAMPFDNGSGGILELTSHADIKNYIVNHLLYAQVVDTEIVVSEAFGDTPAMIRVRDADGKASNIERIELHVYTGTVVDTKPTYFWAKTTSSLETLANRVGDIIQLGNDIDSIVTLSQRIDELIALQAEIANILAVHTNLTSVVTTATSIANVNTAAGNIASINTLALKIVELNAIYADLANILDASNQAGIATAKAVIATTQAGIAAAQATIATTQAGIATAKANEIKAVTAQAATLTVGSPATASYNPVDGKLTFGIPQGTKGDKGDNFTVNAVGLLSQKSLYDLQVTGFSFLALDEALIYFKLSATSADWSLGSPFGKGEKGDTGATGNGIASVSFVSTTDISGLPAQSGATDTYRWTFTDTTTSDFLVYNGLDSDVFMADLTAHTNRTDNPHAVTKAQIGLGSVDNTSDANKPVSTAQAGAILAVDIKAVEYRASSNPLVTTNPARVGALWVNSTSGEIFTCTDITANANRWSGTEGTIIPSLATSNLFGRIWNITDDVYKRVGLNQNAFSAATKAEFTSWLSPTASRVNDADVATASDLTIELDTNTNLPFSYIARKVVSNAGVITAFDHVTAPLSTQQIMSEIPKCYYIDALVVSDSKEYDVKLTSKTPFSVDVIADLGFASVTNITCFNPTAGISSGTVVGNVISSALHPAFAWATGAEADFTYVGSFMSVTGRSTFGAGIKPTATITLPTARTQHTAFGTNFNQHDFWNNSLVQLLAYIERGSNYLEQSGTKWDGNSSSYDGSQVNYDQDNGLTLGLKNRTGTIIGSATDVGKVIANSYRGIENYHSALWIFIDGININGGICYLAKAGSTFVCDIATAPYFASGYTANVATAWLNINKWQAGTFIPHATAGGTTSTKVSDQMYGTTGWRVLRFGGSLANAGVSGLSCWSGSDASSYSYWYIASRASFRKFL